MVCGSIYSSEWEENGLDMGLFRVYFSPYSGSFFTSRANIYSFAPVTIMSLESRHVLEVCNVQCVGTICYCVLIEMAHGNHPSQTPVPPRTAAVIAYTHRKDLALRGHAPVLNPSCKSTARLVPSRQAQSPVGDPPRHPLRRHAGKARGG